MTSHHNKPGEDHRVHKAEHLLHGLFTGWAPRFVRPVGNEFAQANLTLLPIFSHGPMLFTLTKQLQWHRYNCFPILEGKAMRRYWFAAYFVSVHLLLAAVVWKSSFIQRAWKRAATYASPTTEITDLQRATVEYHKRVDGNVPDGSVVFIGDSLTVGLCTSAVACPSVNYGIGGDATVGVLDRLPSYKSLANASAVVLAIGVNDLSRRNVDEFAANYRKILDEIPGSVPVICSAILPADDSLTKSEFKKNARIREFNEAIERAARGEIFVDAGKQLADGSGNLLAEYHIGDGLHLNSKGNAVWIEALRSALTVRAANVDKAIGFENWLLFIGEWPQWPSFKAHVGGNYAIVFDDKFSPAIGYQRKYHDETQNNYRKHHFIHRLAPLFADALDALPLYQARN